MSRFLKTMIIGFLFAAQPVLAADTPPSEASIRELLEITHAKLMVDNLSNQINSMMEGGVQRALKDQKITPEQQKIVTDMQTKLHGLIESDITWSSLESEYITLYQKNFTQQEIDGMLAFYKSPSGKAALEKMPIIMHDSTQFEKSKMSDLLPKLQQLEQDTLSQLQATQPGNDASQQ